MSDNKPTFLHTSSAAVLGIAPIISDSRQNSIAQIKGVQRRKKKKDIAIDDAESNSSVAEILSQGVAPKFLGTNDSQVRLSNGQQELQAANTLDVLIKNQRNNIGNKPTIIQRGKNESISYSQFLGTKELNRESNDFITVTKLDESEPPTIERLKEKSKALANVVNTNIRGRQGSRVKHLDSAISVNGLISDSLLSTNGAITKTGERANQIFDPKVKKNFRNAKLQQSVDSGIMCGTPVLNPSIDPNKLDSQDLENTSSKRATPPMGYQGLQNKLVVKVNPRAKDSANSLNIISNFHHQDSYQINKNHYEELHALSNPGNQAYMSYAERRFLDDEEEAALAEYGSEYDSEEGEEDDENESGNCEQDLSFREQDSGAQVQQMKEPIVQQKPAPVESPAQLQIQSIFNKRKRSISKQPRQMERISIKPTQQQQQPLTNNTQQSGQFPPIANYNRKTFLSPPNRLLSETKVSARLSGFKIPGNGMNRNGSENLQIPGQANEQQPSHTHSQNPIAEEVEETRHMRRDKFGTKIKQGSKRHKIIFVDEFYPNRNLARVIIVESYKKYNHPDYDENNSESCCNNCVIF